MDYTEEYKQLLETIEKSGEDSSPFQNSEYGHLMIDGNRVVAKNVIDGIEMITNEIEDGVEVIVNVKDNVVVKNPIHMCFGLLPKEGRQYIKSTYNIGKNAKVSFLTHCIFPNAVKIDHIMDSVVNIDEKGYMKYDEIHYHGDEGGITTVPKTIINIGRKGYYETLFKLVQGSVGVLDVDLIAYVDEEGVCDLTSKVYGKNNDKIKIKESIFLKGDYARGIAKTRVVVKDEAHTEFFGEVIGEGKYSKGHIDCSEVMSDKSVAISFPVVKVTHPTAKVTHEAAIGSIDRDQIETLMARGIPEDEAIEIVVKGMLR